MNFIWIFNYFASVLYNVAEDTRRREFYESRGMAVVKPQGNDTKFCIYIAQKIPDNIVTLLLP